jgi:hypothetical protein
MAQRPYLKDRLIEDHPTGFVIIVPVGVELPVPLACTLCDHVMRSRDDETSHREFGCCERCARIWAEPRRQAWVDGWRPTTEQIQLAEVDRMPLTVVFDVD